MLGINLVISRVLIFFSVSTSLHVFTNMKNYYHHRHYLLRMSGDNKSRIKQTKLKPTNKVMLQVVCMYVSM